MRALLVLIFVAVPFSIFAESNSGANPYLVKDFSSIVWGFDFVSESEVIVSLKKGDLYYYNTKAKKKKKLNSPVAVSKGQGGLLDVFYDKPSLYVTYTKKVGDLTTTALAKATYNNKSLSPFKDIFVANIKSNTSRHYGSRIAKKDDSLFVTIGDRGKRKHAQDMSLHNGKIIKIPLSEKSAPIVWSLGHRNPQGIDVDPVTNNLYSLELSLIHI